MSINQYFYWCILQYKIGDTWQKHMECQKQAYIKLGHQ